MPIEQMLRDKGVRAKDLPSPSRKALQFLKGLDLDSVVTAESGSASSFPPDSVSFRGLQGHFDNLLSQLARVAQPSWRGRPAPAKRDRDGPATPEEQGQDGLATQGLEALATSGHGAQLEEVYETIVSASEPYRRIDSALDLLGGVVAQTRGVHHDLAASFDRVNAEYFDGAMSPPHLVWSRTFAARKFGHYDHAHDTVMINMVLDKRTVPELAIDFIVYHELLHRQLGITWKSNRIAAHAGARVRIVNRKCQIVNPKAARGEENVTAPEDLLKRQRLN